MIAITRSTITVDAYDASWNYLGSRPAIASSILSVFQARNLITRTDLDEQRCLNQGFLYNPENATPPNPSTRSFTDVISLNRTSNTLYRERMAEGEVVVSPYLIDRITVVEQQGLVAAPGTERHGSVWGTLKDGAGEYYLKELVALSGCVYSTFPPLNRDMPSNGSNEWYYITIDYYSSDSFSLVYPPDLDYELLTRPFDGADIDHAFLQSVVADSYKKGVDALTSLAEGPETISMIVSILKGASNLVMNRKKLVEDIKKVYAHKREIIEVASSVKMKSLLALPSKNNRDISRKNRLITKARKELERDLKKNSKGLLSAVASSWLQFRYAIMPNVYLIRDIAKAAKEFGSQRVTTSKSKHEALALPDVVDWKIRGSRNRTHKAWCQLSFDVSSPLKKLVGVASADILVTAWELVPLSFVVDWFVGVGNAVSTLLPPTGTKSIGITYSIKDESVITFTSVHGGKATVSRESYKRQVMSTEDFSGLYLNVELNWKRHLDAAALLWSISLKKRFRY